MADHPADSLRPRPWTALGLALGLAVVLVLLVLALASEEFQPTLDSDYLLAHVIAYNLGDPLHPFSGWIFSAATFCFPDYLIYLPLDARWGASGLSYPLYAIAQFLLLAAVMAWSLSAAGISRTKAIVAALLGLDVLLQCQALPGHGSFLWRLGIPAYHGGNEVNGFALLALALGAARAGRWSRGRFAAATAVMALGLAANSLLFVQWILPLGLALNWQARRTPQLRGAARSFLLQAVLAIVLVVALRIALAFGQMFFFRGMFPAWPTPTMIWMAISRFVDVFTRGGLFWDHWAIWALAAAGIVAAIEGLFPSRNSPPVVRVALLTGLLGLMFSVAAPIATTYWVDAASVRYLLNWLLLPVWLLALRACADSTPRRWLTAAAVGVGVAGVITALPRLAPEQLVFPHPNDALALRQYCQEHGLKQGLTDYWHGNLLTVEWDFSGPSLGVVQSDQLPYFWCNNIFGYFPAAENGRGLARPAPQFILLNGLNPYDLMQWLGATHLRVTHIGDYKLALLTPEQTQRAGELIAAAATGALQGRREHWLESELPAASP